MSYIKQFLEDISVEIGYKGEINEKVIAIAKQRLQEQQEDNMEEEGK